MRFRAEKRRLRRRPGSVAGYFEALWLLETHRGGVPFEDLKREHVTAWLDSRIPKVSPDTVRHSAALLRHFLRWLHNSEDLPRGFRRAIADGKPGRLSKRRPMPPEHFTLLLEHFEESLMRQAYLKHLREVGWRLEASLSLNVGSVDRDGASRAVFDLPPDDEARFRLKTGSLSCYAVESVPLVDAWLGEAHPAADDPEAPLVAVRENQMPNAGWLPLGPSRAYLELQKACRYLGIPSYAPDLFRHSAATDKARLGWNAPQANPYFGWSPGSKMWEHVYVHLARADQRERVRRDAGIDLHGNRVGVAAMKEQLKEAFFEMIRDAIDQRVR